MARVLGFALVVWPAASGILLGLHRAARALHHRYTRRNAR